jgi:hypothetical protein
VRRSRLICLLAALGALSLPTVAAAQQEPPHGGDNPPPLQGAPPAQDDTATSAPAQETAGDEGQAAGEPQLPATGGEPGLIGLVGAGMVMMGFGLRLRLPGA